jgi:hypothetical protein
VLLVLIHLRTHLTTRALAAPFHTSHSTVDRIIHHLVPVLARHTVVSLLDGRIVPGDGGYRGITSTPHRAATPLAGSSAMTTTGRTAGSEPASYTSSPGSRTGKYCGNADGTDTPSTTTCKPS